MTVFLLFFINLSGARYLIFNEGYAVEDRFMPLLAGREAMIKVRGYGSSTSKEFGAISFYTKGIYISLTGNYLGTSQGFSEEGDSLGSIFFGNFYSEIGYIFKFKSLNLATAVKPLYEVIGEYGGFGISSELGVIYSKGNLFTGIMLKELGMGPRFISKPVSLPLRVQPILYYNSRTVGAGASFSYFINDNYITFSPWFDVNIDFLSLGLIFSENIWLKDTLPSSYSMKVKLGFNPGNAGINLIFVKENSYGFAITSEFEYRFKKGEATVVYSEEKEKATAEMFYEKAMESLEIENYDEAMDYLEISLIWNPGNEKYIEKLGEVKTLKREHDFNRFMSKGKKLYNKGAYMEALLYFKKALDLKEDSEAEMWVELATGAIYKQKVKEDSIIIILKEANDSYLSRNYTEAIKLWRRALEMAEDSSVVFEILDGVVNSVWDDCMGDIKEAENYINRGKIYTGYRKLNQVNRYRKFISQLGEFKEDYKKKLNKIYIRYGEVKKKIDNIIKTWEEKGIEEYNNKNYTKAEEYFRKILDIYPDNMTALSYLKKTKAKLSKKDPSQLYMQGVLAYTKGDYKLALYYWEEVLKIDPDNEKARKNIYRTKEKLQSIGE